MTPLEGEYEPSPYGWVQWWDRAVAAYPPYAEYQQRTEREIPVFVATPR